MTSQEYLQALGEALSTLVPDRERTEILRYYQEYFEEAGPEREAELMEELGAPEDLARKIAREGGFSGGEGARSGKRPACWKWAAGIAAAVVLVLAGTFAALRALHAQLLAQTGGDASIPPSAGAPSDGPADPADAADFVRLDIEIALGSVTVRTGADWGLALDSSGQDRHGEDYQLHYALESGELTVWSTPRSLDSDGDSALDGRVVVTVPEGWTLERVHVKSGLGAIELDGLTADEVTAYLGMGAFEGQDLTSGALDVYSGMGDITLRGPLPVRTDLESGMGDVKVDTDADLSDCAFDMDCGMGAIRVNGLTVKTPQRKDEGDLALNLTTGMGDITVDFAV